MPETRQIINSLTKKYGYKRSALIPILQGVVQQEKYVSEYAISEIACKLNLSTAEVYGTATFYSFLDTQSRGRFVIRVCKTITCSMKGKKQILLTLEDTLKIKIGETTQDKIFTLLQTNCLGWCHKAPAMLINDNVYTELTPSKVREIIISLKEQSNNTNTSIITNSEKR